MWHYYKTILTGLDNKTLHHTNKYAFIFSCILCKWWYTFNELNDWLELTTPPIHLIAFRELPPPPKKTIDKCLPESRQFIIVPFAFNHFILKRLLSKFHQHVSCPTRIKILFQAKTKTWWVFLVFWFFFIFTAYHTHKCNIFPFLFMKYEIFLNCVVDRRSFCHLKHMWQSTLTWL